MHLLITRKKKKKSFVLYSKKVVAFSNCDFYKTKQMTAKTFIDLQLDKKKKIIKTNDIKKDCKILLNYWIEKHA